MAFDYTQSRLRGIYPAGYAAPAVYNNGDGWIHYDSATGIGTDSATLSILVCLSGLDNNPAARVEWVHIPGSRVNMYQLSSGRINVNLSSTGGALVTWQSANSAAGIFRSAGEHEFWMRADLGGTPTMEVWHRQIVAGIAAPWSVIPGAFSVGPTTGTIDSSRGSQTGNELGILATNAGANICDCNFHHLHWYSGALPAADAFGDGGVRVDPELVPFDFLVKAPNVTTDLFGTPKPLATTGTFTDVAAVVDPIDSAPAFATNQVAYDAVSTDVDDFVFGNTLAGGAASAPIFAHEPLTPSAGIVYTGTITSGPFADNATLTSVGSSATAFGASTAYAPIAGGFIAYAPGVYSSAATGLLTTYESNATNADNGAQTEFSPSGGRFPSAVGDSYVRVVEKATVDGTPVVNASAWVFVASAPVVALTPEEWFPARPSVVSGTIDQLDHIITLVDVDDLLWSTGTSESLDNAIFPAGRETTTADGTDTYQRLYYDAATSNAFAVGSTVTQGSVSGVIVHHASLTPTTGMLIFETVTNGPFANNVAITATGSAALANGASGGVTGYLWATAERLAFNPPRDVRDFVAGTDDVRRTRLRATAIINGEVAPYSLEKSVPDAPAPTNTQGASRHVNRTEGMFLAKLFGGDARQFPRTHATSPADPDLAWIGIDITSPLHSRIGFGEFWTTPVMRGLGAMQSGMGLLIDPEDANRILYYGSNLSLNAIGAANYNAACGIYLSTDGGETMTQVISFPDSPGSNRPPYRYHLQFMAYEPGTAATPATRTVYAVYSQHPWSTAAAGPGTLGPARIYKSVNGGSTWATDGAEFTAGTFGVIHGLETRDNGSGGHDLYLYSDNGLFRRPSGSATWTEMNLGATGTRVPCVQVRGTTIWASREGNGIWKATNGTTFSRIFAYNVSQFSVSKVSPYNWIFASSRGTNVAARWSEDGGATWTHTNGGATVDNVIESIPAPGQFEAGDTFSHKLHRETVFFIPHETIATECLVSRFQHMGRLVFAKNGNGNIEAIYSSTGFDASRINNISWGDRFDEYAMAATDRSMMYTDHGPAFTHDALSGDIKGAIFQAIEGVAGEYTATQGAGPIIFRNNGHRRVMFLVGDGKVAAPRIPIICLPTTSGVTKVAGSAGAGTGSVTSVVMPKGTIGGTYQLRCTSAGTPGTYTLYAPQTDPEQLGAVIGTTNGSSGAQSITMPQGGNCTFSLSAGSSPGAAGGNPTRHSLYYNPIGNPTIMSGATGTGYGTGWRGEANPVDPSKGCAGRGRYVMSPSAVITRNKVLTYEFWGYSDGNVIWGLNGNTIMRSPDEGETWATFFAPPGGWSSAEQSVESITPSVHNNQRCYRVNTFGQVHRVVSGTATLVFDFIAVMDVLESGTTYVGRSTPRRPPGFSMTEDPNDPNLLTVSMGDGGGCTMIFRTTVGGGAGSTWFAAPDAMLIRQELFNDPYNGDVLTCSRHGTTVLAQPAGYHAANGINPSATIKGQLDRFIGDAGGYVGV